MVVDLLAHAFVYDQYAEEEGFRKPAPQAPPGASTADTVAETAADNLADDGGAPDDPPPPAGYMPTYEPDEAPPSYGPGASENQDYSGSQGATDYSGWSPSPSTGYQPLPPPTRQWGNTNQQQFLEANVDLPDSDTTTSPWSRYVAGEEAAGDVVWDPGAETYRPGRPAQVFGETNVAMAGSPDVVGDSAPVGYGAGPRIRFWEENTAGDDMRRKYGGVEVVGGDEPLLGPIDDARLREIEREKDRAITFGDPSGRNPLGSPRVDVTAAVAGALGIPVAVAAVAWNAMLSNPTVRESVFSPKDEHGNPLPPPQTTAEFVPFAAQALGDYLSRPFNAAVQGAGVVGSALQDVRRGQPVYNEMGQVIAYVDESGQEIPQRNVRKELQDAIGGSLSGRGGGMSLSKPVDVLTDLAGGPRFEEGPAKSAAGLGLGIVADPLNKVHALGEVARGAGIANPFGESRAAANSREFKQLANAVVDSAKTGAPEAQRVVQELSTLGKPENLVSWLFDKVPAIKGQGGNPARLAVEAVELRGITNPVDRGGLVGLPLADGSTITPAKLVDMALGKDPEALAQISAKEQAALARLRPALETTVAQAEQAPARLATEVQQLVERTKLGPSDQARLAEALNSGDPARVVVEAAIALGEKAPKPGQLARNNDIVRLQRAAENVGLDPLEEAARRTLTKYALDNGIATTRTQAQRIWSEVQAWFKQGYLAGDVSYHVNNAIDATGKAIVEGSGWSRLSSAEALHDQYGLGPIPQRILGNSESTATKAHSAVTEGNVEGMIGGGKESKIGQERLWVVGGLVSATRKAAEVVGDQGFIRSLYVKRAMQAVESTRPILANRVGEIVDATVSNRDLGSRLANMYREALTSSEAVSPQRIIEKTRSFIQLSAPQFLPSNLPEGAVKDFGQVVAQRLEKIDWSRPDAVQQAEKLLAATIEDVNARGIQTVIENELGRTLDGQLVDWRLRANNYQESIHDAMREADGPAVASTMVALIRDGHEKVAAIRDGAVALKDPLFQALRRAQATAVDAGTLAEGFTRGELVNSSLAADNNLIALLKSHGVDPTDLTPQTITAAIAKIESEAMRAEAAVLEDVLGQITGLTFENVTATSPQYMRAAKGTVHAVAEDLYSVQLMDKLADRLSALQKFYGEKINLLDEQRKTLYESPWSPGKTEQFQRIRDQIDREFKAQADAVYKALDAQAKRLAELPGLEERTTQGVAQVRAEQAGGLRPGNPPNGFGNPATNTPDLLRRRMPPTDVRAPRSLEEVVPGGELRDRIGLESADRLGPMDAATKKRVGELLDQATADIPPPPDASGVNQFTGKPTEGIRGSGAGIVLQPGGGVPQQDVVREIRRLMDESAQIEAEQKKIVDFYKEKYGRDFWDPNRMSQPEYSMMERQDQLDFLSLDREREKIADATDRLRTFGSVGGADVNFNTRATRPVRSPGRGGIDNAQGYTPEGLADHLDIDHKPLTVHDVRDVRMNAARLTRPANEAEAQALADEADMLMENLSRLMAETGMPDDLVGKVFQGYLYQPDLAEAALRQAYGNKADVLLRKLDEWKQAWRMSEEAEMAFGAAPPLPQPSSMRKELNNLFSGPGLSKGEALTALGAGLGTAANETYRQLSSGEGIDPWKTFSMAAMAAGSGAAGVRGINRIRAGGAYTEGTLYAVKGAEDFWAQKAARDAQAQKDALEMLARLREQVVQRGTSPAPLDPRLVRDLESEIWQAAYKVSGALANLNTYAKTKGVREADRVFYDYVSGKTNLDRLLGVVMPFSMWQTRNPGYWAEEIVRNPSIGVAMKHYISASEDERKRRGLPIQYFGSVSIGKPIGDKEIFVNPIVPAFSILEQGGNFVVAQTRLAQAQKALEAARASGNQARITDAEDRVTQAQGELAGFAGGGLGFYPIFTEPLKALLPGAEVPGTGVRPFSGQPGNPLPQPVGNDLLRAGMGLAGRRYTGLGPNEAVGQLTTDVFGGPVLGSPQSLVRLQAANKGEAPPAFDNSFREAAVTTALRDLRLQGAITREQMLSAEAALKRGEGYTRPVKDKNLEQALALAASRSQDASTLSALGGTAKTVRPTTDEQDQVYRARQEQANTRAANLAVPPHGEDLRGRDAALGAANPAFLNPAISADNDRYAGSPGEADLKARVEHYFDLQRTNPRAAALYRDQDGNEDVRRVVVDRTPINQVVAEKRTAAEAAASEAGLRAPGATPSAKKAAGAMGDETPDSVESIALNEHQVTKDVFGQAVSAIEQRNRDFDAQYGDLAAFYKDHPFGSIPQGQFARVIQAYDKQNGTRAFAQFQQKSKDEVALKLRDPALAAYQDFVDKQGGAVRTTATFNEAFVNYLLNETKDTDGNKVADGLQILLNEARKAGYPIVKRGETYFLRGQPLTEEQVKSTVRQAVTGNPATAGRPVDAAAAPSPQDVEAAGMRTARAGTSATPVAETPDTVATIRPPAAQQAGGQRTGGGAGSGSSSRATPAAEGRELTLPNGLRDTVSARQTVGNETIAKASDGSLYIKSGNSWVPLKSEQGAELLDRAAKGAFGLNLPPGVRYFGTDGKGNHRFATVDAEGVPTDSFWIRSSSGGRTTTGGTGSTSTRSSSGALTAQGLRTDVASGAPIVSPEAQSAFNTLSASTQREIVSALRYVVARQLGRSANPSDKPDPSPRAQQEFSALDPELRDEITTALILSLRRSYGDRDGDGRPDNQRTPTPPRRTGGGGGNRAPAPPASVTSPGPNKIDPAAERARLDATRPLIPATLLAEVKAGSLSDLSRQLLQRLWFNSGSLMTFEDWLALLRDTTST